MVMPVLSVKNLLVPAHAEREWAALLHDLTDASDAGRTIPCAEQPDAWWTDDPNQQTDAAISCSTCPALTTCADYADAAQEQDGVWGGTPRRPARRRARPAPASTASRAPRGAA